MEKTSFHLLLTGRPFALVLVASAAVVALFGALGWSLGTRLPNAFQPIGKVVCAAFGLVMGGIMSRVTLEVHEDAARIDLQNAIVSQNPETVDRTLVEGLGRTYGLNLTKRLNPELKNLYDRYLETMIPMGEASLTGKEAGKLVAFKNALGLTDEEAASVHMDVGRRLSRSTFETDSKTDRTHSRKVRCLLQHGMEGFC